MFHVYTSPVSEPCGPTRFAPSHYADFVQHYRPPTGEGFNYARDVLVQELQQHVRTITAPYKYPRIIEFVPELPKTISGKIRRGQIRAQDQSRAGASHGV